MITTERFEEEIGAEGSTLCLVVFRFQKVKCGTYRQQYAHAKAYVTGKRQVAGRRLSPSPRHGERVPQRHHPEHLSGYQPAMAPTSWNSIPSIRPTLALYWNGSTPPHTNVYTASSRSATAYRHSARARMSFVNIVLIPPVCNHNTPLTMKVTE